MRLQPQSFSMLHMTTIALTFLLLALWPSGAQAQYALSDSEDVVIAFFKTAGTPPNYETLAKISKQYYLTPPARQDDFLSKEKARLQAAYNSFDPDRKLLTIRTSANITLYKVQGDEDTVTHGMTISFGKDDALFFPYEHGTYKIAVLPQKMGARFDQNLAPQQYDLIRQTFGDKDNGRAPLYVQLKPVKAYLDQPYRIGGTEQWALVADVAGLILTDSKGTRLWTYAADWYVSPMTEQLRNMYDVQTEEKQRIMDTENPVMNAR